MKCICDRFAENLLKRETLVSAAVSYNKQFVFNKLSKFKIFAPK